MVIPVDSLLHFFVFIPIIGYAEIHYRLGILPSRLYQAWPEILADVPYRLEPGTQLPVLLMVKDAHRFPVYLENVDLHVLQNSREVFKQTLLANTIYTRTRWWEQIFSVSLPDSFSGFYEIKISITARKKGRKKIFINDNYKHIPRQNFRIFIAKEKLPQFQNQYIGDLHTHSSYTSDQLEFGSSLAATKKMAASMGLDFCAVTDHSYDLDNFPTNFLRKDANLTKWHRFQKEVARLNADQPQDQKFLLIPGEEASVRNNDNKNIHFLILNSTQFFEGSGDGGENWPNTHCEYAIGDICKKLPEKALAIAAHPFVRPLGLEAFFLKRGSWTQKDCRHQEITGLQILNGRKSPSFFRGLQIWKELLLQGKQIFIYAGSDAHGNFNYYRQVQLPFWSMAAHQNYVFGKKRTVLTDIETFNPGAIIEALRRGRCYITEGPALHLIAFDRSGEEFKLGEISRKELESLTIKVRSSEEFGALSMVRLYYGNLSTRTETLFNYWPQQNHFSFEYNQLLPLLSPGYFRLEVSTATGFQAWSNPIWFLPASFNSDP